MGTLSLPKPRFSLFNIHIDTFSALPYSFLILEVFTSVPPDPVSIVHCRHWVVLLSFSQINSTTQARKSGRRSCRSPAPSTSHSLNCESLGVGPASGCRNRRSQSIRTPAQLFPCCVPGCLVSALQ